MMIIFEQVFMLIVFAAAGFILAKKGLVKAEHSKMLTGVLVYVFSACNTIKSFATNFTIDFMKNNYLLLVASVVVLGTLCVIMHFVAKPLSESKYERYVYEYSLIMPNYGYIGYALAESLLGAKGLISVMVFGIPMSIYIYLYAFCRLSKKPMSFKGLLNALTISMMIGMVIGIFGIPLPRTVTTILDTARVCMAPTSMILAGIVISRFNIREITSNARIYIVTFLRLIVVPVAVGVCLRFFFPLYVVQTAVIFLSVPCGMNTVVFPDLAGEDCRIGAGLALVSSLLSCLTIPVVFSLFGIGA